MGFDRRTIANYLREFNLLQLADDVMFVGNFLKNRSLNKRFLADHPDYVACPASLAYDAYGNIDWRAIHDMGLETAQLISDLIKKNLSGSDEIKILEWGCGPARVIRHFKQIDGFDKVVLFGSDYNKKTIKWCQDNIKNVEFLNNNLEPPLPLESETFDCIYSISVFTHLSEKMHHAWMEDLFRVLKPNGILIFTTHGDFCAKNILPEDRVIYDSGKLLIKDQVDEGKKHYLAYHPPKFVREDLLKNYIVLNHIESQTLLTGFCQDVWVVKKYSENQLLDAP